MSAFSWSGIVTRYQESVAKSRAIEMAQRVFSFPTIWHELATLWAAVAELIAGTPRYVNVMAFGAKGDGVTDDLPAFQAAYASLPSSGGVIVVPTPPVKYRLNGTGATVALPKIAINVTKNNVWVIGEGSLIEMHGWTQTDSLLAANNDGGAGANVFSVVVFGNGVVGGGVRGLVITGETDGTAIVVHQARAKGIGLDGCSQIYVSDCRGSGIVGNLVHARGNGGGLGTAYDNVVTRCYAELCAENGINFQGGTSRHTISHCHSRLNQYHGFESGTDYLVCTNNTFTENVTSGINQVGRWGTFTGNTLFLNTVAGINFGFDSVTFSGSFNEVSGNNIQFNVNAGIKGGANTGYNNIHGNTIKNNGDVSAVGEGITLFNPTTGYRIRANSIGDDQASHTQKYGVDLINASFVTVAGNDFKGNTTSSVVHQVGGDTHFICDNSSDIGMSLSALITNLTVRNNGGFMETTPAQITATQNDYNASFANDWRLTSDAIRNITGIAGGYAGRVLQITNAGSFNILLLNNNASSLAANRIITVAGAGTTLYPKGCATLVYDGASSLWRVVSVTSVLQGTATFDPPSLADGVGTTTTVTVTGAQLGDFAESTFSLDLQSITLTTWVSAADTVSVRFQNESGGVLDLASGTLRARVRPRDM